MTAKHNAKRYCQCGGSASITSSNAGQVADVAAIFDQFHAGEGHGPATPAQAARARRKAEAAYFASVDDDSGEFPSAPSTPGGGEHG